MNRIVLIQHYFVKGQDYGHSEKFISDKMVALLFLLVCLIIEKKKKVDLKLILTDPQPFPTIFLTTISHVFNISCSK